MDNNIANQTTETNQPSNWQSKIKSFFTGINVKTVLLILIWVAFLFTLLFANTQFLRSMDDRMAEVDRQRDLLTALRLTSEDIEVNITALEKEIEVIKQEILNREQLLSSTAADEKRVIIENQIADRERRLGDWTRPDPDDVDATVPGPGLRGQIETYRRMIPVLESRQAQMQADYATLPFLRERRTELNNLVRNSGGLEQDVWEEELERVEVEIRRIERAHDRARQVRGLNDARAARSQTVGYFIALNAFLLLTAVGLTVALERKVNNGETKEEKTKEVDL